MRKILAILLAVMLMASKAIPAAAVTPKLDTPSVSIPDITNDVSVDIPDETFDHWFEQHPLPKFHISYDLLSEFMAKIWKGG